jgi:hypothetical protein
MTKSNMNVVIVGGGVSGMYAAYKLAQKNYHTKITILEKLPRLGGRILTEVHDNHIMEYGPMRFEPELQPNFAKLLNELDISSKVFPPYTCPSNPPDFNKINFEEIQAIKTYSNLPPAFAILKFALKRVLDEQWNVDHDNIHSPGRDKRKTWLKKYGTFQGRHLNQHGLWDTLAHVLSKEALDYLQHKGTFYHMLWLNPNAADQICFMLDILATANLNLITVDGGSYNLINVLLRKYHGNPNINIQLETCVYGIEELNNQAVVSTSNGELICDHVIFTCQKNAYASIRGFSTNIRELLDNSVMIVELFKIFIVIEDPPFDECTIPNPNYNADKVPCREIHYGYDTKTKTGMIMIYGDMPCLNYWSPFIKSQSPFPDGNNNQHLLNHLNHYLRIIFADVLKVPFAIKHFAILDWSKEPYKTGVHLWRPGYISHDVIDTLRSFGSHNQFHICGETFSDYQGFIEGCLRTVDGVIECIT